MTDLVARMHKAISNLQTHCTHEIWEQDFSAMYEAATELERLQARLAAAERVCEAVEQHFGPDYASDNWNIRNATRASLEAWRAAREGSHS